jgi:hypothetical protein
MGSLIQIHRFALEFLVLLVVVFAPVPAFAQSSPVHHDLRVALDPADRSLRASDRLTLPHSVERTTLLLHAKLQPSFSSPQAKVTVRPELVDDYLLSYQLEFSNEVSVIDVEYSGVIHHALSSRRSEQARGFRRSSGIIDRQGVFLSASSLWYPRVPGFPDLTFSLQVTMPTEWSSVSQGARVAREDHDGGVRDSWRIDKPQQEIYLVAARFSEHSRAFQGQGGRLMAQVFLRQDDPVLANRYLDATERYLKMYEQLLGPYAFSKFALVENFWETGFGMPSFTLLGSRVIRFPFILTSSYPHEVLHNWWGNGVYVDFDRGNWSEGLTAYLADHLFKEQLGRGAAYRQQSLQKYRDYALKQGDIPLSQFRSRHSSASQAVGYGKTLMLFHMLRKKLGDEVFIAALRRLYTDRLFQVTAFSDVQTVFEQISGVALGDFFEQWVQRRGAPRLQIKSGRVLADADGFRLDLGVAQRQSGLPYQLDIPVAVTLKDEKQAELRVLSMSQREQHFSLSFDRQPLRIDIDPQFDVFRELVAGEVPPAFSEIFGAENLLVVLPSSTSSEMGAAWRLFASDLSHMGPEQVEVVRDDQIDQLPAGQAVVVLGWSNRFSPQLQQELAQHQVGFERHSVQMESAEFDRAGHAFAWVTRTDDDSGRPWPHALITADIPSALPGLGRKIPHYHKYSYLGFEGEEPVNRLKGRWAVTGSPMTLVFSPDAPRMRLAEPRALIDRE